MKDKIIPPGFYIDPRTGAGMMRIQITDKAESIINEAETRYKEIRSTLGKNRLPIPALFFLLHDACLDAIGERRNISKTEAFKNYKLHSISRTIDDDKNCKDDTRLSWIFMDEKTKETEGFSIDCFGTLEGIK